MATYNKATTTFTRPANATQYTAGDVINSSNAAPLVFYNVTERAEEGGMIVDAICINDKNNATRPNARLYLYDSSVAGSTDNSAYSPTDTEVKSVIGYIDFSTWHQGTSSTSGNSMSFASNLNIPFRPNVVAGSSSIPHNKRTALYGELVERGTYTPNSGENFTIRLGILRE